MEISEIGVHNDLTIADFLQPISDELPAGASLKETPVYAEIQAARLADDPNTPRGVWEHDLKKSDWNQVSELAESILLNKSKDIQVAIWFLEAQVHLYGIERMPVCLLLLAELSEQFWEHIHPLMEDGDVEYRTNLFAWMNDKLSLAIRQMAIAESVSGETFTWLDWERGHLESSNSAKALDTTIAAIKQAIDQTNIDFYRNLWQDLADAIISLNYLTEVLANRLGQDAPSFAQLADLLNAVSESIVEVTGGRSLITEQEVGQDVTELNAQQASSRVSEDGITDRQKAYAMLAEAAEYLLRDDPHSPVPHLVYKAIEWGRLSTSELFAEIFIRHEGNLNIFDVLGIERTNERRK